MVRNDNSWNKTPSTFANSPDKVKSPYNMIATHDQPSPLMLSYRSKGATTEVDPFRSRLASIDQYDY